MKSYDLPPDTGGMSPEEAGQTLNRIMADAKIDADHPWTTRNHPQHGDFLSAIGRLQEAKSGTAAAEDLTDEDRGDVDAEIAQLQQTPGFVNGTLRNSNRPAHDAIVEKLRDLYARRYSHPEGTQYEPQAAGAIDNSGQAALREEATGYADELVRDFNYAPSDLPETIEPYHAKGLQMQLLAERGDYATLGPMIDAQVAAVGDAPPALRELLGQFHKADSLDARLRQEITQALVSFIFRANQQQHEAIKLAAERRAS